MAVSADTLRLHLEYSEWSNSRILDAAAQLSPEGLNRDFGTADRSVLGTLVHTFGADRVWLARVQRKPNPVYSSDADRDLGVLQREWPLIAAGWRDWAARLDDESALEVIPYKDMSGNPWQHAAWEVVLHVVNHGTHHRGQAAGFLRSLGHTPPKLDLIYFYRERAKAQGA